MNEQHSISEMLCAFLDGELEGAEAETLFYLLAGNQELQMEMRKLIALNAGFRKELLTPPDRLRHSIEQRIGQSDSSVAVAGAVISTPSLMRSLFLNRAFLMLASAVCAVLLTLQFTGTTEQGQALLSDTSTQSIRHQQTAGSSGTIAEISKTPVHQPNTTQDKELQVASSRKYDNQQRLAAGSSREHSRSARVQLPPDMAIADADRHIPATPNTTESILPAIPARITDIEQPEFEQPHIAPVAAQTIGIHEAVDPANGAARLYALHLRSFSARSFPDFDVDPLVTPTLNNIGIGLSYRIGDEHSIGIEVGQENLLQHYIDTAGSIRKTIEQNYLAFWGGATYRFVPNIGWAVQPYTQAFIGGTRTGPMARSMLGVEYRTDALGIAVGVEGTLHVYRHQNTWYSTQKLGISYSLSFHF